MAPEPRGRFPLAGTFPGTSNTQQHDINGQPLAGALLTVYQGGSTSALASTFQDIGLILPASNPLVADGSGRIPLFFVADGSYGLRLTDQFGLQGNGGFFYPQVPSIGASSSGGGGTPVDPTTVAATGDIKFRAEQGTIAGWVRINGRTIGNGSSGASERANADCQALFIYIWSTYADAICPVPGGRGANALADFNANKQITLLDGRARDLRGLDDMGNAALNAFTGVTFRKGNATTAGSDGGVATTTLTLAQLPAGITSTGVFALSVNAILNTLTNILSLFSSTSGGNVFLAFAPSTTSAVSNATASGTVTSNNTGGQAFPQYAPFLLGTFFWKL